MAKIDRYNGNLEAPASAALGTERTIFGTGSQSDDLTDQFNAFLLRGWGIVGPSDQPTLQDFNAMGFTLGQIHAYLHQMGIAEYNALQEYHTGSVTNVAGVLYVSLVDSNVGNTPASSPVQWSPQSEHGIVVLTTTQSWAVPAAMQLGYIRPKVTVYGGGAGGGRSGTSGVGSGGGGGGGKSTAVVNLTGVPTVSVTVGAGGAGASVAGNQGTGGGTSSFGILLSASGGEGGFGNGTAVNAPGGGGIGSIGQVNESLGSGTSSVGANGGNGGGGGPRASQSAAPGNNGVSPGSGGSGSNFGFNGGNGAAGICVIEW